MLIFGSNQLNVMIFNGMSQEFPILCRDVPWYVPTAKQPIQRITYLSLVFSAQTLVGKPQI
jgi:hypothetical protein